MTAPVQQIVSAASAALGRDLREPAVLSGGSGRSCVLRCADPRGESVIVKTYPQTPAGVGSFAAEAAGLEVTAGTGLVPEFLAADAGALAVVMSDLGTWPSLADALLTRGAASASTDPADPAEAARAASAALVTWARACGQLSAATDSRRLQFERLHDRYLDGRPDEGYATGLPERVRRVAECVTAVGIPVPRDLDADLAEVASAAGVPGPYPVFSPGDLCPDNNMLTPGGLQFFDFESAGLHSVFLDAAYIRMPYSTCWCVFRLPPALRHSMETAYRHELCAVWPDLADDSLWQPGVRRAVACWTLDSMWWLLRRALDGDALLNAEAVASPRSRQLMRYRWRVLAGELESAGELSALAGLMRSLLAATENWQAPDLPYYPALR